VNKLLLHFYEYICFGSYPTNIYSATKEKEEKKTTGVYINMCVCKSFHKSIFHREPEYINDAKKTTNYQCKSKKEKTKS